LAKNIIPHKSDKNQGKKKYFLPKKKPGLQEEKTGFFGL
jgi:hypothetical protein